MNCGLPTELTNVDAKLLTVDSRLQTVLGDNHRRIQMSARAVDRFVVLAIVALALFVRVVPAYDRVIKDGRVIFASNDPWIHMRNADNLSAHWPVPSWFDPFRLAPEGQETDAPMMDIAIAGAALVSTDGAA